jgi:hypothetical protein
MMEIAQMSEISRVESSNVTVTLLRRNAVTTVTATGG